MSRKKDQMYIAIVVKDLSTHVVQRTAFSGANREDVIVKAIQSKTEWERNNQNNTVYRVFVGELYTEAVIPIPVPKYTEVSI